jgi:glycosyltransferase involved in cell wall biosynthesis
MQAAPAATHDEPRVVITHDFLDTYGGAERVTQEMASVFPAAPVVSILGRRAVARRMAIADRWTSVLPARNRLLQHYRLLAPAMPAVVRSHRLPDVDLVLSSSYAFAHRFRAPNDPPHVCYCHSPLRFVWSMTPEYRARWVSGRILGLGFDATVAALRRSDRRAAREVTRYLTQSPFTAKQIEHFYGRRADVIGAPVNCDLFRPAASADHDDYFLVCGRLVEPYKKIGIAIEAFRQLGSRLMIAGDGPAMNALRAHAPPNVTFLGHLADGPLVRTIQRAAALLFPSTDDFGLMPVEAMACGRPVLAFDGGGNRYTVLPGVTGERFPEQTPDSIVGAVKSFSPDAYDSAAIRRHAEQWDRGAFRERLRAEVLAAVG